MKRPSHTGVRRLSALERVLPLELVLCMLAIALCLSLMLREVPAIVDKAHQTESLWAMQNAQIALVEDLAEEGALPDDVADRPLGLRPAWSLEDRDAPGSVVVWLCGDREPPAGWVAAPASSSRSPLESPMPSSSLPSVCRKQ